MTGRVIPMWLCSQASVLQHHVGAKIRIVTRVAKCTVAMLQDSARATVLNQLQEHVTVHAIRG